LSPIHTEVLIFVNVIYDCTTFTSHENVLKENIVKTEGIKITLYLTMRSISLVRHCCFY